MPNRLQPLNLTDFTGGLALRRSNFQLSESESPDMLNVDVDPRGGFYTRRGWQRLNSEDILDTEVLSWRPRNAMIHPLSGGENVVYVVNNEIVYSMDTFGVFTALTGPDGEAAPHDVDFASWGDDIYMACGQFKTSYRRTYPAAPTALGTTFSEIDTPVGDMMPQAELCESHGGYMFVAGTRESGVSYPNRIRWSHPNAPDSWRTDDFIDIEGFGGRITALMSFQDHLLIFKTSSLWALYGYDEASWQLVRVSTSIGCPSTTAVTRSETACYFYSGSSIGGIYAYVGEAPVYISERLATAFEELLSGDNVFVSWAGRRLWVSIPWVKDTGVVDEPQTTFVFSADIGSSGAWTAYRSSYASIGTVLDGSDTMSVYPLAAMWSDQAAMMASLDYIDGAYDQLVLPGTLATEGDDDIVTEDDDEIIVMGSEGQTFESYYRTRWLHADWPDRKKSWRRPTFVCREVPSPTDLVVEAFRDYDEADVHRTRTLHLRTQGQAIWSEDGFDGGGGGFDWTEEGSGTSRGADWGAGRRGSSLVRGGSLGTARAIQLRVSPSPLNPTAKWGVDGVVAKYVMRRFR